MRGGVRTSSLLLVLLVAALAALPGVVLLSSGGCSEGVLMSAATPAHAPVPAAAATPVSVEQPRVRVLLADHTRGGVSMPVRINGPWTLMEANTREIVLEGPWMQTAWGAVIQGVSNGVVVNIVDKSGRKKSMHLPRVRIMPKQPGTLCVGGRAYRGVLDILANSDGSMTLINDVALDDYIGSVVTGEMPFYWPPEALKAQAVVARTYVCALIAETNQVAPRPEWHVEATGLTHQEYPGIPGEHPLGLAAVAATAGQVLTWHGSVFRAYFSSTCGGHTEACGLVWEDYATIPPLAGTKCGWCMASKYYAWVDTISAADIERALRKAGKDVGDIRDLKFTDANGDGHMDEVVVEGQRDTLQMRGNDFRLIVGPSTLKSLFFTVKRGPNSYEFTGHGWGHGVGMCQYGAMGLAAAGKTYTAILKHYYPDTELKKVY